MKIEQAAGGFLQWICLGSQTEHGKQNSYVGGRPAAPTTLSGKAKLAAKVATLFLWDARKLTKCDAVMRWNEIP